MSEQSSISAAGVPSIFRFDAFRVRVVIFRDQPWWVLADICDALGLTNPSMIAERLDAEDKAKFDLGLPGQIPTIINESGLYDVILRSNKPEAKRFRHWITSEVLPSIRKTGAYGVPQTPKTFLEALKLAAELEEKRLSLEAKVAADAPKVESFEALMKSDRSMSITDASKHFGLHPRLEVFPYLRGAGYLTARDLPTQAAIDAGYLSVKETTDGAGNVHSMAVVEAWQLEVWRAHVVHQVKRWHGERAAV